MKANPASIDRRGGAAPGDGIADRWQTRRMIGRAHMRRRFGFQDLAVWYLAGLMTAGVAAVIGAGLTVTILSRSRAGCLQIRTGEGAGTWTCPDGIGYAVPAILGGGTAALGVIALITVVIGLRADAATIARMSRHLMWLVLGLALIPGLGWPLVTLLSAGNAYGLIGLAGVAFTAVPLVAAYRWQRAVPAILGLCLLFPVTVAILWQKLFLLLPFAAALSGGWVIALFLWWWAKRLQGPTADPIDLGLS
ncbi:hypothetical protein [Micromonospora sp. 4G55]|uniref:hypothetical protein n=1 Tax=Micromonospora sp. 4G55 TaxID=2806102 RepID=UPI001A57E104|nr:hypothetical protein [Micromonospora sp. 4G55]MBM0257310.1 hypothetical protein [Micromonospora sp. 4G55]